MSKVSPYIHLANLSHSYTFQVGSIFVIQICALIMIVVGVLGKFTAFISTIPYPIVGGLLCVLFGMITIDVLHLLHISDK